VAVGIIFEVRVFRLDGELLFKSGINVNGWNFSRSGSKDVSLKAGLH
jgi:hypothetical protein